VTIPQPLLEKYLADPLGQDENVRAALRIKPEDYYTVSVWPVPGKVTVDRPGSRTVRSVKISKSSSGS
jgi:hypothetical protein